MSEGLNSVLDDAVKLENFIKVFRALNEEMGSICNCLLTHTKVRLLSCGRVLVHPVWLHALAYLVAIFSGINNFYLSLQGLNLNWKTVLNLK